MLAILIDLIMFSASKASSDPHYQVTSNSITLRWTNGDIGNSPIIAYRIKYKITYGEWEEKLVKLLIKLNDHQFHINILLQVSFYAE